MEAMRLAWDFFQNQILGMKWLSALTGRLLCALGVDITGRWGGALQFFIYDTIKIFVLLSVLIFGISYIQSFFPPERTKKILGRFHGLGANTLAALLGTVTPFCSCSSIPLFMGFTSAGIPLGVSFSFLISSPLVDLGSLVLLTSVFGGGIAVAYRRPAVPHPLHRRAAGLRQESGALHRAQGGSLCAGGGRHRGGHP